MVAFGPAEVEFFIHAFREARYVTLASFVLVLYDYALTLGDEIRSFWTPGFSRSKALFFANRYSSIWVVTLRLYSTLNTSASPSLYAMILAQQCPVLAQGNFRCRGLQGVISFGALVVFSSYGFVMLMRVYALYKRQTTVTRVLMPLVIVLWITNLTLLIELAIRLRVDVAVQEVVGGCPMSASGGPPVTWRNYVPVLIQLTLLTGMIVYKAVQQPMASAQARDVLVLFVRDGTVVYFGMSDS
ncbi:hypothetical protein CPB86DRAFT_467476 [Serendipita vermifera]|nr:hypothetical protein CPB86DRAFT_467476 [Serendipita vermifera]